MKVTIDKVKKEKRFEPFSINIELETIADALILLGKLNTSAFVSKQNIPHKYNDYAHNLENNMYVAYKAMDNELTRQLLRDE